MPFRCPPPLLPPLLLIHAADARCRYFADADGYADDAEMPMLSPLMMIAG